MTSEPSHHDWYGQISRKYLIFKIYYFMFFIYPWFLPVFKIKFPKQIISMFLSIDLLIIFKCLSYGLFEMCIISLIVSGSHNKDSSISMYFTNYLKSSSFLYLRWVNINSVSSNEFNFIFLLIFVYQTGSKTQNNHMKSKYI